MNRRVVVKAAAGLTAMIAAGDALHTPADRPIATAQQAEGTRSRSWSESESIDTNIKLEGEGWVTLLTEFPFWALGFAWDTGEGSDATVEFQVSYDAESWADMERVGIHSDGGPSARDERHHTPLYFADGQEYVRYRTFDGDGNLVVLDRFQVTYIDPTDGPWEQDRSSTMMRTSAVNTDTDVPPTIITRAQWGANESFRFDSTGEIWPAEYQRVEHAIVHHAAVNYGSDGYVAVRSIYHYHAVTQGWGDIGYNYVVDVNGNIFEGRVGGANVIGGHAYEYANGSSGICVMGDFSSVDAPYASRVALANIIAYVTRDLDTYATKPFHASPALPTICAHRDVNQSTCPGDGLYRQMPWIRDTVAATLDQGLLDSQKPGGIVPGDWVKVVTENNTALPMRSQPGMSNLVIGSIPNGTRVEVERGPLADSTYNWYLVIYSGKQGWVPADYLQVDPPASDPIDGFSYGQNLRVTTTTTLRASASSSSGSLGTVSAGAWAFIMAGPLNAGGASWFQIRTQSNGDGWVTRNTIELAPVSNPTPRFPVGSNVITTTTAPMRVRPGIAQTADGSVAAGRTLQVSVAPIAVTGRIWYGVYGGTGTGGGWMEEGHLRAGSNNVVVVGPVTNSGQQFRTTDSVNLRSGPGTSYASIATLATGVMGTVIGGSIVANGYTWWQVRTDANQQGWVASTYIQQVQTGTASGTGYGIGVTVRTTISVNMRSDAGTGYPVVSTLPSNTSATIVDGPRIATGYTWWRIRTIDGRLGWVSQSYLVRTSGLPTIAFKVGEGVRTHTDSVQRSNPLDPGSALPQIAANSYGVVIGGPRDAGNLVWWQVRWDGIVGWVPQTNIVRGNKFVVGASVKSTRRVVFLSDVNVFTTARTLEASQYGVVTNQPRYVHGELWYPVRMDAGLGWVPQRYLVPELKFAVGASARTTRTVVFLADVNLFVASRVLAGNEYGVVIQAPRFAHGELWYMINTDAGVGWVPQTYLAQDAKFVAGDSVRTTRRVVFLQSVTTFSSERALEADQYGHALGSARYAHGELWYYVRMESGLGWVPQKYLVKDLQFAIGESVRTTRRVIFLADVNTFSGDRVLEGGEYGVIVGAPRGAHGELWYWVRVDSGVGWVPQQYFTRAEKFSSGQIVEATRKVVHLASPGSFGDGGVLTGGTIAEVLAGPEYASGHLWYRVANIDSDGWTPQDYLTLTSG